MPNAKKGLLFSVQIVFLLVLLTNLPIVFASTDPMDESRIDNIIWETYGLLYCMDPHKSYCSPDMWIHANIYESLFTYPWDSADTTPLEPLLAESVAISGDGLTYTFTLRQGVTFHDGTPFNATCVQMNFWRMLGRGWDDGFGPTWMVAEPILGGQAVEDAVFEYGEGSPQHIGNWTDWTENSGAVEVLDTYEVRIKLAYPYAPFLAILARPHFSMVSPTFFMAHGAMSPESDDWYLLNHACGTGPYIFDEWIQGNKLTIVLNENYWRSDMAKVNHPHAGSIMEFTFKKNTDSNSRMMNLKAGRTDACDWPITNAYDIWNNVTTRGDGTLQSLNPDIKVWTGLPDYNVKFLGFNMNDYLNYSGEIVLNPFQSWDLRAAISYVFDYDALIDNIMKGIATRLAGPIPAGLFGHDDDLIPYEQDLDEAVTHWNLAMAAGLNDVWENSSYELNIYYNKGNTGREASSLLVKQALEEIIADPTSTDPSSPLTINVDGLDWASYLYQLMNRQLPISFLGWSPDYADTDNYVGPFIHSNRTYPYRMGLEDSTGEDGVVWDAETVDGWIDSAAQSQDPAVRIALYEQIQEVIVDHCAFIWGYQSVEFHVERYELNGYVYNPMRKLYFYHYYKSLAPPGIPPILMVELAVFATIIVITLVILKKSSRV